MSNEDQMGKTPQKLFTTADIWTASYLDYRGLPPLLENRNGRVVFLFPVSDNLYKLLNAFQSGDAIPLSEYVDTFKALKRKMFEARAAR